MQSNQDKILNALIRVSEIVNENYVLKEALQIIVNISKDLLGDRKCIIRLYEEKEQQLVLKAYGGMEREYAEKFAKIIPEKLLASVLRTGEVMTIADIWQEEIDMQDYLVSEGIKSVLAIPLIAKTKTLGTIVIYSNSVHHYTQEEKSIYKALANQAAIVIENSYLYAKLQQSYMETIRALVRAEEAKDTYTKGHSERVAVYSLLIGQAWAFN